MYPRIFVPCQLLKEQNRLIARKHGYDLALSVRAEGKQALSPHFPKHQWRYFNPANGHTVAIAKCIYRQRAIRVRCHRNLIQGGDHLFDVGFRAARAKVTTSEACRTLQEIGWWSHDWRGGCRVIVIEQSIHESQPLRGADMAVEGYKNAYILVRQ